MGEFAQRQNINQALSANLERTTNEESIHIIRPYVAVSTTRTGFGGANVAGHRVFGSTGRGLAAVVTALWVQLRGMVCQVLAVDPGAVHQPYEIVGGARHLQRPRQSSALPWA